MSTSRQSKVWLWSALILGGAWLTIGCSPTSLGFLLMPWVDDKVPAKCKLASADKEVTVAIHSTFTNLETRPELMPADGELAERLAMELRKRCGQNKEKVKIVPPAQVRGVMNQVGGNTLSLQEIGEKLKADYVVSLEITDMSLYPRGSANTLYRGACEISVTAVDVAKPAGETIIFQENYRSTSRDEDPSGLSSMQYRARYLSKVARDLARWFTAFPPNERFDMD
ncbi:MAG: hypothetical protein L0Y72_17915 [Gemmataceae bacterium]|nr:hypothetical protein [Gemmataceae bacterium]MCI0740927.1 hypothetical protein [Gemmataceae bacterium]